MFIYKYLKNLVATFWIFGNFLATSFFFLFLFVCLFRVILFSSFSFTCNKKNNSHKNKKNNNNTIIKKLLSILRAQLGTGQTVLICEEKPYPVVTSGYSISLIRDPAGGTSQLYLRVAWTSAFKQFFLSGMVFVPAQDTVKFRK